MNKFNTYSVVKVFVRSIPVSIKMIPITGIYRTGNVNEYKELMFTNRENRIITDYVGLSTFFDIA